MTSLEHQLKRLKTPQTEEFRQHQIFRTSFLYDRKDAAGIDCDTHLRLANKGLRNLIKLNPDLEEYTDLLNEESKTIERSALTQAENDKLTQRLRRFINNTIVPFFMLNHCHEVFEYLIYKYHIHTYQPNDILCAILPYHETRLFARALLTIPQLEPQLWGWLEPYKTAGVPIPKDRIMAILANKARLGLVELMGDKLIEINHDADKASTYTSFYTTIMMCVLEADLGEKFYVTFMPHVYKAVKKANNINMYMAGLVLIGYLAYTQDLNESYLDKLVKRLAKTHEKLRCKADNRDLLDEYHKKVLTVITQQQQQYKQQHQQSPHKAVTSQ